MSGAAFMRLQKLKGSGIWSKAARHNRRTIQAELGASGHIDPTRSHLNTTIMGPPTPEEVARLAKAKMEKAGITKDRKNGVVGVELVFSLPTGHRVDLIAYFTACAQWAGANFGGMDNIISVDIHRDEAQDHAHVLLVPLLAGRLNGSDLVGGIDKLRDHQLKFYEEVARLFGFSKPRAKLLGEHKAKITRQILDQLRNDPAVKSAAWAAIRDTIERDPMPYALALGIDTDKPTKSAKTMAQIFTSKGKGKSNKTPIGNSERQPYRESVTDKRHSLGLCRESVSPPPPKQAATASNGLPFADRQGVLSQVAEPLDIIRERDCDQDPRHYNPDTGEFWRPPPAPASRRAMADMAVRRAIELRK